MNDTTNKTARPLPTAEEVRALLEYDPETGVFRWLTANSNRVRVGGVAGRRTPDGYTRIKIDGRGHQAHRLAWLYVHGAWPAGHLDHRDGTRSNNALANLREVTPAENNQNSAKRRCPTSSRYIGVSWDNSRHQWLGRIYHNNKQKNLGRFATQEDAYAAYLAAKSTLHTTQPAPRANAYDR